MKKDMSTLQKYQKLELKKANFKLKQLEKD